MNHISPLVCRKQSGLLRTAAPSDCSFSNTLYIDNYITFTGTDTKRVNIRAKLQAHIQLWTEWCVCCARCLDCRRVTGRNCSFQDRHSAVPTCCLCREDSVSINRAPVTVTVSVWSSALVKGKGKHLYSALHGIQTTLKRSDMDHAVYLQ